MSKPIHPIRKMCYALEKVYCDTQHFKTVARHVKPLLDALEEAKSGLSAHCYGATADTIDRIERLLATWRAKP